MPGQAAAAYIGVGLSSLYGLARDNKIESFTSGRRRLFVTASLERYIADRRAAEGGNFRPQKLPWQRQSREPRQRLSRSSTGKAAPALAASSDPDD
jgi:excisionase family DNA binding protein